MLLYAVRHAESLANANQTEDLNADLSPLGQRQARALAERFRSVAFKAIYSSPYTRSLSTAIPLAEAMNQPICIRPDLCEHHHIVPTIRTDTGLDSIEQIKRRYPRTVSCPDYSGPFDWVSVDEPVAELITRMQSLCKFLKARWTGEDDVIIVFGHGSPIARMIEAWLTDQPGPSFCYRIDNGSVSALRFHQQVSSLICLNDVSHLKGLPVPSSANYCADGTIKPYLQSM